jgi:hypothetical protein
MRRTFSKNKATWTRVRMEEVAPIIGFLLAGIVASVTVLVLETVYTTHIFMQQQQQNVFCCIAAVHYVDAGHPVHPSYEHSERNALRPAESNHTLRFLEHRDPTQVV